MLQKQPKYRSILIVVAAAAAVEEDVATCKTMGTLWHHTQSNQLKYIVVQKKLGHLSPLVKYKPNISQLSVELRKDR